MGFWSKLKKGLETAGMIAPMLPIPEKAKRVIDKIDDAVPTVEAIVTEAKKKEPPKP